SCSMVALISCSSQMPYLEADRDGSLVGPAHDLQLEAAGLTGRVEGLVQGVHPLDLPVGRGDDQIAALEARSIGRAVGLDAADEHAVALGQADRPPEPSRYPGRRDRHAQ